MRSSAQNDYWMHCGSELEAIKGLPYPYPARALAHAGAF